MDFEYRIENDGIKIFEHKNRLSESVIIPEIIKTFGISDPNIIFLSNKTNNSNN